MSDKTDFSSSDKDLNLSVQMTFATRANGLFRKEPLVRSRGIFNIFKWPFCLAISCIHTEHGGLINTINGLESTEGVKLSFLDTILKFILLQFIFLQTEE